MPRFYVNTLTKKSQWDKPTEPARAESAGDAAAPPPVYTPGDKPAPTDTKQNPYVNNNESEDAKLARRLQEEEDAKARASPAGAAASYGGGGFSSPPYPDQLPPRSDDGNKSRGLIGKIFGGKKPNSGGGYPGAGGYGQPPQYAGQPAYGAQPPYAGYPQQGGYGAGYPQQGGYYQQGPPPGGYYGGGGNYAPQQAYGRPGRAGGGGLGAAGGAALGLGGGLIGGMLLENAIENHDQAEYQQGFGEWRVRTPSLCFI